jgi:hypothetical protein
LTFCCYGRSALGVGLSLRYKGSPGCDYRSCPCSEHILQSIASKNAFFSVLGAVAKLRRPTISFVMSGRLFIPLYVRMEKLAFHYTGTSVHERPCSRTIRFTNKFSDQNVSDDERCLGLRTRKVATAVGDKLRVSARECQLLVNFGSVHIPA